MSSTSRHGTGRLHIRSTTHRRDATTTRNHLRARRLRELEHFRQRPRDGSRKISRKVLCYTGIDSNKTGVHTPDEFLNIAKKWSKNKDHCNHINTGKYLCPKLHDLDGWMKWSGAEILDEVECRKTAKSLNDHLMKFYKDTLRNIKSGKYQNKFRNTGMTKSNIRRMTVKTKKMAEKQLRNLEK
jgi:hypothetical protein